MDKKLLQRYVEGKVSPEEIETVVKWLDADEANVREFMALHKLYDISLLNKPAFGNTKRRTYPLFSLKKISVGLGKIAAILLLAGLGLRFLSINFDSNRKEVYQTVYAPPGQRAEVILPDSTKVWLNAKSKIVYTIHRVKQLREVALDGEAFFHVTPDKESPFIVKTSRMDIKVVGTEFNVIAYSDYPTTEISLLKGSVELSSPLISGYRMREKETVRYQDGKLYVSPISDYDYFMWKEGLICFNNEPVGSIMKKLELYFDIKIEVEAKELLNIHYTGKFRANDGIEQVIKVLQLEHKFSYIKNNELNVITIK